MPTGERIKLLLGLMAGRYRAKQPDATVMPLEAALELGIDVGKDPNVGMTSGGVVLVSSKPFDKDEARRFSAMIDMDGDWIYLPPFEWERPCPS